MPNIRITMHRRVEHLEQAVVEIEVADYIAQNAEALRAVANAYVNANADQMVFTKIDHPNNKTIFGSVKDVEIIEPVVSTTPVQIFELRAGMSPVNDGWQKVTREHWIEVRKSAGYYTGDPSETEEYYFTGLGYQGRIRFE